MNASSGQIGPGNFGWKKWVEFFLLNFATPVVFFWTFRVAGAKPAITFAVAVSLIQAAVHLALGIRFSPFFLVSSGFTVLFGALDLLGARIGVPPKFFRFEPFARNFLIGLVFLLTLMTRHSLLGWFAAALPAPIRPVLGDSQSAYFRRLTWIWAFYFILKSFFFLWLAFQVDLGTLILLRSLIGGGTLWLLIVGEVAYRKWFRK